MDCIKEKKFLFWKWKQVKHNYKMHRISKFMKYSETFHVEYKCSNCGDDSKKTFNYIRTVANGEVYWCKRCKTENLVSEKPDEDNY